MADAKDAVRSKPRSSGVSYAAVVSSKSNSVADVAPRSGADQTDSCSNRRNDSRSEKDENQQVSASKTGMESCNEDHVSAAADALPPTAPPPVQSGRRTENNHEPASAANDGAAQDTTIPEAQPHQKGMESNLEKSGTVTKAPSGARPCIFFAQGTCRNGNECRFSHDLNVINNSDSVLASMRMRNAATSAMMQPPPPPVIINIPPGQPVFSIDVECVATAVQHTARSIAQVALVDEWCRPVFNVYIKQDMPVVSYLHELTGLTKELLDECGIPLAEAMALLRSHLTPNAILVGQSIQKDVQWLQLAEGIDYSALIDLSGLFRVWNPSRGEFTNFSQDHCAKVWIGIQERTQHNAVTDAAISMSLFNAYRTVQWDQPRLLHMQQATLNAPRLPGFSAQHPVIDGCCMGNRKKCICGAPFH